jgi:hypothetical protein
MIKPYKKRDIDWTKIDWSKPSRVIVAETGWSMTHVWKQRKRVGHPSHMDQREEVGAKPKGKRKLQRQLFINVTDDEFNLLAKMDVSATRAAASIIRVAILNAATRWFESLDSSQQVAMLELADAHYGQPMSVYEAFVFHESHPCKTS